MRILYLDLDTLRPDHLGCYGYGRNTSPNIDSIARDGIRFDNYYCTDAPCLPSRAALMTGRFGIHTGVVGHGGTCADLRLVGPKRDFKSQINFTSLPGFLRRQQLHTVFIGGFAERHSFWPFYAGFSEIHDTGMSGMESAEHVTPTVMDWIERNAHKDNWYLQVNYWDPHTPYRAPADFGNPFKDQPRPQWITEPVLEQHRRLPGPHTARNINMFDNLTNSRYPRHPGEVHDIEGLQKFFDGYDCGIRYMDDHIGRLFAKLREKGVFDDLAVVISSDHGENLGELGIYAEHGTADNITCRIPMIIRWPGGRKGHVDSGLHYNLDLIPTLAELLKQEAKPCWDGASYAGSITDGKDCGREYLVISQCAHVCQRGVRWGDWIYIRTYHDGYHLFPKEMLFDLKNDPHEQNNLAERRPDVCREGLAYLDDWHDRMMRTMPEGYSTDPMEIVLAEGGPYHARGRLAKYVDFLKATGREHAIPELQRRHPGEFVK